MGIDLGFLCIFSATGVILIVCIHISIYCYVVSCLCKGWFCGPTCENMRRVLKCASPMTESDCLEVTLCS